MLVAARTPPYYSVLNPVERVHCTLNIGLNGLALARTQLEPNAEKLIKGLISKKEWRKTQAESENKNKFGVDYKLLVQQTTRDVYRVITKRFESLKENSES